MTTKIDQAFINAFVNGSFGLSIAHENMYFNPTAGTEYAELINIPNNTTALSMVESDQTDGVFRIILRWPINEGSINVKLKADEILSAFSLGDRICYDGQCSTITSTARQKGVAQDGWYKVIITIGYYAIIGR